MFTTYFFFPHPLMPEKPHILTLRQAKEKKNPPVPGFEEFPACELLVDVTVVLMQ